MAEYIITNRPEPIDFEIRDEPLRRTIQNAKNLLMTQMGEVPYDRYRGFDPALYHLPIEQMRFELMAELDRVMLWEPGVEVVSATAVSDETLGVLITVVIDTDIEE